MIFIVENIDLFILEFGFKCYYILYVWNKKMSFISRFYYLEWIWFVELKD